MPNHLSLERSPYLLQHLHDPVDWYPWGSEALEQARHDNKPIFLSIGYSACHWCHVMEKESFKNQEAADLLNTHFISIKVDREERPDLDELYTTALQLMIGHGGWPMSLFLLPDGLPFYGGTYFPLRSSPGHLGFLPLLSKLVTTWQSRRDEVVETAMELAEHVQQATRQRPVPIAHLADPETLLEAAVRELRERYDENLGGFGGAPKFPPHHTLRLLHVAASHGMQEASRMQTETLDRMALGGLYDHVGGGFHRYSRDVLWLLPHFEKMLYDNALLARVYAEAFAATGVAAYARVARETCDWVLSELRDQQGGFQSSLDADSEGEEGRFYLWTHAEVAALAGTELCQHFHLRAEGNFDDEVAPQRQRQNIPHLHVGPGAAHLPESHPEPIQAGLARLRQARQVTRVPPPRDNKVITSWNGLMISALTSVGQALQEPRYLRAAQDAAHFCLTTLQPSGNLLHQSIDGVATIPAFLDDYAYLAEGLLDLASATGETHWRTEAECLIAVLLDEFWDSEESGFFFTSHRRHEKLIARTKEIFDGALPSPNGVALRALLRLGGHHTLRAQQMLASFGGLMERAPQAMATWLEAVQLLRNDEKFPLRAHLPHYELTRGESATIAFTLSLPPGWHIHPAHLSEPFLSPTRATLQSDLPSTLESISYPEHYREECTFAVTIQLACNAKPGEYSLALQLSFQPCSDSACDSPKERIARVSVTLK